MMVSADELDLDTLMRDFKGSNDAKGKQGVTRDETLSDIRKEL